MEAETKRRMGLLPQIDIAGEAFYIDVHLHELRHARDFTPIISLRSFTLTDDGSYYQAFYHPMLKQVVDIDPKLTEFPDAVVLIRIPNELGLDPIGTARKYGIDQTEVLKEYPIKDNLKAEIISLSETGVPQMIARNRELLKQEHEQKKKEYKIRRGSSL